MDSAEAETGALLRTALERAGKVRNALAELREQAFASAASAPNNQPPPSSHSPDRKQVHSGGPALQVLPVVLLPGFSHTDGAGIQALVAQQLSELRVGSLGSLSDGLGGAASGSGVLGTADGPFLAFVGERHASPKTSRQHRYSGDVRGQPTQQHQHQQQQQQLSLSGWQHPTAGGSGGDAGMAFSMHVQGQQQPQQYQQQRQHPSQRGWQHPAAAGGGSDAGAAFDDVLAALRAEGLMRLPEAGLQATPAQPVQLLGSAPGVAPRDGTALDAHSTLCDWASRSDGTGHVAAPSSGSAGGTRRGQRQTGEHSRQSGRRGHAGAAFDPAKAERQLREKLEQANAANRSNQARMRRANSRGSPGLPRTHSRSHAAAAEAGAAPVPRLHLAAASRAGSTSGSRPNSGRLSSRENEAFAGPSQQQQQQQQQWQAQQERQGTLPRARQRGPQAHGAGGPAAGSGFNFLALARDERQEAPAPAAARAAPSGQGLQASAHKESRVSLSELLSATSAVSQGVSTGVGSAPNPAAGAAAYPGQSSSVGLQHSAYSVGDAASAAAVGSSAAGGPSAAPMVQAPHRQAGMPVASGPGAVSSAAVVEGQAGSQRMRSAGAAANAMPGEASAAPAQGTPRQEVCGEGTSSRIAAGLPGQSGISWHDAGLLGQLRGQLQSPPATPLDTVTAGPSGAAPKPAAPVPTACSSASDSSGQASTASSGSPGAQHRATASPVRGFPPLGDQEPPQPCQQGSRPHSASYSTPPAVRQRSAGASGAVVDREGASERSASSIGRKRANSEAGCVEEPASAKKHGMEVGGKALACRAASQGAGTSAGTAALEAGQPQWDAPAQHTDAGPVSELGSRVQRSATHQASQPPQQRQRQDVEPAHASGAHPRQQAEQQLDSRGAQASPARGGSSRLVVPVLVQHSPTHQQRERRQQWSRQEAASAAAGAQSGRPAAVAARAQPDSSGAAPAPKPAASVPPQQARSHTPKAAAASSMPERTPPPAVRGTQQATEGAQDIAANRTRAAAKPAPQPAACPPAGVSPERQLPSHSHWLPGRSSSPEGQQHGAQSQQQQRQQHQGPAQPVQQRQQPHRLGQVGQQRGQPEEPQLRSTSVLITGGGPEELWDTPPPGSKRQPRLERQGNEEQGGASGRPPAGPSAAEAAAPAAPVAAASVVAAPTITPRRRTATLEAPEAELCLRHHPQGKHLLGAAPELADTPGRTLLDTLRRGLVVRKAWVRPNFKQGGSTRCIQVAPGTGGRLECLYPSGLFRKPLRFAVRRAVVNVRDWRPGEYLVLDTARGMLRLEPATAAEHALWVLGLNAAFLASGAPVASGTGGSSRFERAGEGDGEECRRLAVGDMRWSAAVLLG